MRGEKKSILIRMLLRVVSYGRLFYSFKLLVGKHAQIVILWWNRFHLGHILDYEFIIVQREYLINRVFPYKRVTLDSIMLHHRIFNCGDDDLDGIVLTEGKLLMQKGVGLVKIVVVTI